MLNVDVSIRNAQADLVAAEADSGFVVVKSGTGQTLCTANLPATPFNTAVDGTVELANPVLATVTVTGVAAYFELYRANMTLILTGSVSAVAGDMLVSDTSFVLGDTLNIEALAYVAPGA